MNAIVVSYDQEQKRFIISCSRKGLITVRSASKVYFQMMKNSRRRRVEKRIKECMEKGLPEPVNTNLTGTEAILDTLVNDITIALEQK